MPLIRKPTFGTKMCGCCFLYFQVVFVAKLPQIWIVVEKMETANHFVLFFNIFP